MLKRLVPITVLSIFLTDSALGQFMQLPAGAPKCHQDECVYSPVNVSAESLAETMLRVCNNDTPLYPGHVNVIPGQVAFKSPDASMMRCLNETVTTYDRMAEFNVPPSINVAVDIYSVDSTTMDNLMAQISFGKKVPNASPIARASGEVSGTEISLSAALGKLPTNFIRAQLDIGREFGTRLLNDSTTYNVFNGDALDGSRQQTVYRDGAVQTSQEFSGLNLSGTFNIGAQNNDQVMVTNFNLKYGVPTGQADAPVKTIRASLPRVFVTKGRPYVLVSGELSLDEKKKGGLPPFSFGRKKAKANSRILILISVTPMPRLSSVPR